MKHSFCLCKKTEQFGTIIANLYEFTLRNGCRLQKKAYTVGDMLTTKISYNIIYYEAKKFHQKQQQQLFIDLISLCVEQRFMWLSVFTANSLLASDWS